MNPFKVSTSESLKDALQAVMPTVFASSNKTKQLTVTFQWESVSLSEAINTRLDAGERKQALESALNEAERATLTSLQARVKAAEKALGDKLGQSRLKDSRVTVKGMTACKA